MNQLQIKIITVLQRCGNLSRLQLELKSDLLLLTDVFENFRSECLEKYELDPAQYVTAPSLSWDAICRFKNMELELLTDIDMVHFFKKRNEAE